MFFCFTVPVGTPLHYAVECNHMNLVEKFLSGGADVESLRKSHLQTPLMLACQLGHVTVAERLLEAGAEIDRQTEECSSALTLACHFGHKEVVDLLIGTDDEKFPHLYCKFFQRHYRMKMHHDHG